MEALLKTLAGLVLLPINLLAGEPAAVAWFTYALNDKPCGYAHFARSESDDRTAPVVLLQEMALQWRGQSLSLKLQSFHRQDEYLTPVKLVSTGAGDDELKTYTATIAWEQDGSGRLQTRINNRDVALELPAHTLTFAGVIEILPRLPFRDRFVLHFHSLEAEELNLKQDHTLTYRGKEAVVIHGDEKQLHRFEQTGRGIQPCQYWLDDNHQLVRVLMDGRKELRRTDEATARAALRNAE